MADKNKQAQLGTAAPSTSSTITPPPKQEVKNEKEKEGDTEKDVPSGEKVANAESKTGELPPGDEGRLNEEATANQKKENGCCHKCCNAIMRVFAHDAIYGSFVGPHPVSFNCLCAPCKKCCCLACIRRFCVASIATKVMYFIMLAIVSLLACFFIIPWPLTDVSLSATALDSFYPCQKGKLIRHEHANGGCKAHAGYFMVYRCFVAFATLMLFNSIIMMFVKSTKQSPQRAKIHQGFWLYKYLALTGLLFLYFLCVDGSRDPEGIFEFTCSIVGNIAHLIFSMIVVTFIMDLVELWVMDNQTSGGKWANFIYWTATGIVFLVDFLIFVSICRDFTWIRQFPEGRSEWPYDNCKDGEIYVSDIVELDYVHITMICASLFLALVLVVIMSFRKRFQNRFPYTGWMQVSVLTLFNFCFLWSALYSSPNIHSRPRCNWAIRPKELNASDDFHTEMVQTGSYDVYFRLSGFMHGLIIVLSLLYFAFVHGPRSKAAPLSVLFNCLTPGERRMPVFPDEESSPEEFLEAIDKLKVWDDETEAVGYSWSFFYVMLALGSLSLMMAMTNFTNPWAADRYNSSLIALIFKYSIAVAATFVFGGVLLLPCNKIYPVYEFKEVERMEKKRLLVVVPTAAGQESEKQLGAAMLLAMEDSSSEKVEVKKE